MAEGVKIPVGFDVDTSDLTKLKEAVNNIISSADRLTKRKGKNALPLYDSESIKSNIAQLTALEGKIADIQKQIEVTSGRNIGVDYSDAINQVEEYRRILDISRKEQMSAQGRLGAAVKEYNAVLANSERVQSEINEILAQAKSENRDLTQAEKDKVQALQSEAELRSNMATKTMNEARASYTASIDEVANNERLVEGAEARKAILSDIAESDEKSLEYNQRIDDAVKQLNSDLDTTVNQYREIAKTTKGIVDTYNGGTATPSKAPKSSGADSEAKANTAALNKEADAAKKSAAQYYYKLRAVKMLGFVFNQAYSAVDKFGKKSLDVAKKSLSAYLKLIPGVNSLKKAISGIASGQSKLAKEMNKSAKSGEAFNTSIKGILKNVLKYGLGIRSLYVLFNKLRKAVIAGLGEMSQQIADVNMDMSSIVTSLNQMKAAVTAAIQPILSVLAPALERVAAAVAEIAYQVASFIAALTGQSVVYKASRVWTDYAASLDKTGKSAKKAKKELAGFDELNVLHTDDDSGGGAGGMGWDPVELSQRAVDMANKMKEIFNRLFDPLKKAWDKTRNYIVKSWRYAANQMKLLMQDVARDFWRVWEEANTQKIFENMLITLADIGQIVGNLAGKFREAWNYNNNGYRILKSIRDIILIISDGIKQAADYTVQWSRELSFISALTELADNMQTKLVPAVQQVVDLFRVLYEQILLKIVKDFIEKGLPQLERILGNIAATIGNVAENIRIAIQSGSNGIGIIEDIESLLGIIADTIEDCSEKTRAWAAELNFRPLLESSRNALQKMQPMIEAISGALSDLWNNTLLPFWQYLIEKGFPKLLDALAEITGGDWSGFSANAKALTEALEPFFELAWETLVQILKDVGLALKDFLNSDDFASMIDSFKSWVTDADPEDLAHKIESLAKAFIEIKAALALISKVIWPIITGFMTLVNVGKQLGSLGSVFSRISGSIGNIGTKFASIETEANTLGAVMKNMGDAFAKPLPSIESLSTEAGSLAGPGGVLVSLLGVMLSLKGGTDMMSEGFSLSGEALTVFGGVLTTVGAIIAGVAAWPAVIIGAIVVLIANLGAFGDELYDFFVTGFGNILNSAHEFFENLGHNFGVWVGELLSKLVTFISELPGKIQEWIDTVDWKEFGINILKGILAIFMAPIDLLVLIVDAIGSFLDGFIKGLQDGFDMHSPSKKMEPYGKNILEGILQGIIAAISSIGTWIKTHIFDPIINGVKSAFGIVGNTATKFKEIGTNLIEGLKNGIINKITSVISTIKSKVTTIKNTFTSNLSSNSLLNTGYNLLVGLTNGIIKGLNKAYEKVKEGCNNIINFAKSVFNISSPSKVFEEIGEYDMEGLSNGIEKGATDTESVMEDAMSNLIPEVETSDTFADTFLDSLTIMKQDAIDIVNSMVDELSSSMNNLDGIFDFDIANKMSKLSTISVPNIAQGKTLPSSAQFVQATSGEEFDYTKLANVLSTAIVDAIGVSSYNNTSDRDVVVNIDGREVFRAVKSQNEIYRKSTGKSAF